MVRPSITKLRTLNREKKGNETRIPLKKENHVERTEELCEFYGHKSQDEKLKSKTSHRFARNRRPKQ